LQKIEHFWLRWIGFSCIIILLLAGALWNPSIPFFNQEPTKAIQRKVSQSLKQLEELNKATKEILVKQSGKVKISFSALQVGKKYQSVYIFKNKELVYWSNYHYVPHWSNVENINKEGVIADSKGKYLTYRSSFLKEGELFDVVTLIPLYITYPIDNNYLKSGVNEHVFFTTKGRLVISPTNGFVNVTNDAGSFLFAYTVDSNRFLQGIVLGFFLLIVVALYMVWLYRSIRLLLVKLQRYTVALDFLIRIVFCVFYKGLALLASKFNLVEGIGLFDPSKFAYSALSPSIGDFLINAVMFFVISAFFYKHYLSFLFIKKIIDLPPKYKQMLVLCLLALSYGLFLEVYNIMDILQRNSQSVFDITSSVNFDWLRVTSIIVLLLSGLSYFYVSHVIIRLAVQCVQVKSSVVIAVVMALLYLILLYVVVPSICLLPLIHLVFLLVVLFTGYIKQVSLMRYQAYLYFFFYAIEIAWVVSFAIQGFYIEKLNRDKEKYYHQLFVDNDIQGEYLLHDALGNIAKDSYLKNVLLSPFSDKKLIDQKIRKIHLSNYFDKFDVYVHLFDVNQKNYNDTTGKNDLNKYLATVLRNKNKTQFDKIYLVEEASSSDAKKYYCIQTITYGKAIAGYVVIELKYKKIQPNSVYPELLVDRKYRKYMPEGTYHYAVYEKDQLIYSNGTLNYYSTLNASERALLIEEKDGYFKDGFHHWGKVNDRRQLIVISSEASRLYVLVTNFSFLFIVNVLLLLVLVSVNLALFRFSKKSVSYASRIQIYINIAFFLPLSIMSIVSLSVIANNYKEGLNKKTTHTADDISILVAGILDQQKGKTIGWSNVQEKILDLSRYSELDLNVYTNKGVLYFSNQQDIYKKEIVSRYLEPEAYTAILEQHNQAVLLNEHIGSLTFNMVYTSIRSQETGLIYGVLSIPFFESKNELDRQVIQVLNTIMNVFSFTFIALLIVSYFASRYLTYPLHMITQKLSRISLTSENEPLQWKGEDEIGKLVIQYNTMLKVLEENKKILSRTEKESAWKEMAKQVAHEIKNPLTPMKLSLQHLLRRIDDEQDLKGSAKSNLSSTIQSLLSQIDNLSDIAGSFSAFAKMPEPIQEDFDLTALMKELAILHSSSSHFRSEIQYNESLIVKGDQGWMNNVLNNLIINAFQSIPESRQSEVILGYTFHSNSALIYVKDNGSGIPEDIKSKVFQPNFSTKFAGSGIGLALAKRGVEYMGGKIWFETMNDQGTTFYIQLPIKGE